MPTVPRLTNRQVQDQPQQFRRNTLQGPRFANDGGEAIAKIGQATQGLMKNAIEIENKEIEKANQLAVLEADQKLSALETKLLYDRETGAMNQKGKDSFGLPDTVLPEFEKQASDIESSLANDAQRAAFRKSYLSRSSGINKQLNVHISREGQKYDAAVTESYLANERNAAFESLHDEERIELSVDRQRNAVLEHVDRNGLPEEYLKLKIKDVESKTYSGVISKIVDSGQDMEAKKYFEKYKDKLTGEDKQQVQKILEAGMLMGESQRKSDDIWSSSGGDLGTAMNKAEKINDPKLRDETMRRIRQKKNDYDAAIKARQDDNFMQASEYIKANPAADPRDIMPASQWESLTLQQQANLKKYASNPANNNKLWLDFLDKDPSQLSGMSRAEFEQNYWVHFDSAHRTRAENMWTTANESDGADKLSNTLTFKSRVDGALRSSKIIDMTKSRSKLNDTEAMMYTQFEQAASKAVEDFERNELGGKRKASGQEMQKIIDDMVVKKVFVDKNWLWSDPVKPAALITDEEKGKTYVPIKEIPQKEINAIENMIKSKGKKVTQDKVQRAYAASLLNDVNLFKQIIGE